MTFSQRNLTFHSEVHFCYKWAPKKVYDVTKKYYVAVAFKRQKNRCGLVRYLITYREMNSTTLFKPSFLVTHNSSSSFIRGHEHVNTSEICIVFIQSRMILNDITRYCPESGVFFTSIIPLLNEWVIVPFIGIRFWFSDDIIGIVGLPSIQIVIAVFPLE